MPLTGKTLLALTVSLLVMLISCDKPDPIPTQSTYTFYNSIARPVTIDFYGNKADYNTNSNRLLRYTVPADSFTKIPFDIGKTYWMDWYSDNYAYNNWPQALGQPDPGVVLIAAMEDGRPTLQAKSNDTLRSVMLADAAYSRWKGVVTDRGSLNGVYELTFRKDLSGEYTYTDTLGHVETGNISYSFTDIFLNQGKPGFFRMQINDAASQLLFNAGCGLWSFDGWHRTGRDTIYINNTGLSYDHYLTRQ